MTITLLYDNNLHDPTLEAAWGFSALIEHGEHTLLFDTGGDGSKLLTNMDQLGIDPGQIQAIALSHAHSDHTGGLRALLDHGLRAPVYLPPSFPASFKREVAGRTQVIEVTAGQELLPNMLSTGEMGTFVPEAGLILLAPHGPVLVTGCAHPGIAEMVSRAAEIRGETLRLALGGFHLRHASRGEILALIAKLQDLGLAGAAPCHCSGDTARALFQEAFAAGYRAVGVGSVLTLEP
jgi:7,8-dihydropterin-6-yl-methyl-4-(beta-D-ribofuranosyl)aminobenzene 5'-phosphate synthase